MRFAPGLKITEIIRKFLGCVDLVPLWGQTPAWVSALPVSVSTMFDTLTLAVALKSSRSKKDQTQTIGEQLEALEKLMERCKVLYEQYFMGIQKIAPAQVHRDAERKIRELTQKQIRNTAMRFRFTTLSQKFGSYNSYWRRTIRAIEQGRYIRDIHRATRRAQRHGADIPEEMLAAMPKRMREKIRRQRKAIANQTKNNEGPRATKKRSSSVHSLDADAPLLGDLDMDSLFESLTAQEMAKEAPTPAPLETIATESKPVARVSLKSVSRPRIPAAALAEKFTARKRSDPRAEETSPSPPPIPSRAKQPPQGRPITGNSPRPPKTKLPPGMTNPQAKRLYETYIAARKKTGERTDNISYNKLVSTLNRQAPKIMKKHGVDSVDFEVRIKNSQVILKAKPKKS